MINMGENYRIGTNKLNIILYSKADPKENEECEDGEKVEKGWRLEGYFGSLKGAIKHLIQLDVNRTHFESLEILADRIEALKELVEKVCPSITVSAMKNSKEGEE